MAAAASRRVEAIMGTTFTLELWTPPDDVDPDAIDGAFQWLHEVDARFSTYRPDSEISLLRRGELDERDASAEVRGVLAACEELRRRTDGFFDIRFGGPGTPPDPSGYVKGWAIERAAERIAAAGARDFALNGGGDLVARGRPPGSAGWRVGIRHPFERDRVAAVISVVDAAVATSGGYERGAHIRDPHTGAPPAGTVSVTVVGPSLTIADAYATAVFAMGAAGPGWLARQAGFEGCAITADGRLLTTPGFEALRLRD
jgi:thiamine biosynthesis lipoprotein